MVTLPSVTNLYPFEKSFVARTHRKCRKGIHILGSVGIIEKQRLYANNTLHDEVIPCIEYLYLGRRRQNLLQANIYRAKRFRYSRKQDEIGNGRKRGNC